MKLGIRTLVFLCALFFIVLTTHSTSIGSEVENLLKCSKYDYEEKVFQKLIRMEFKMETFDSLMKKFESEFTTGLEKISEVKSEMLKFIEGLKQDAAKLFSNIQQEAEETFRSAKVNITSAVSAAKNEISTVIADSKNDMSNTKNQMEVYKTNSQSRFNNLLRDISKKAEDVINTFNGNLLKGQFRLNETLKHVSETSTDLIATTKQHLWNEQARINDSLHVLETDLREQQKKGQGRINDSLHVLETSLRKEVRNELNVFSLKHKTVETNVDAMKISLQSVETNINGVKMSLQSSETNINGMKTSLQKANKQVAVTACANRGTVKASTPMLFQSIITSYGVTQTQSLVTSGIFKCEDPGLYIVVFTAMSDRADSYFHIYKNSQYLVDTYTSSQSGYFTGTASVAVQLDINDQITVKPDENCYVYGYSTRQSTCITLIKVK